MGRCEGARLGAGVVAGEEGSPVREAGCGEAEVEQDRRAETARGADLLKGHVRRLFVCVVVCDTADVWIIK